MRAAVLLGQSRGEDDVDEAIELTNLCQALRCLPRAGGLFDQDCFDVYKIRAVLVAQAAKAKAEQEKNTRR